MSDNAHESRLKEVIEKYLRNNNYSLGGTEVHAAEGLMDRLNVSGMSTLANFYVIYIFICNIYLLFIYHGPKLPKSTINLYTFYKEKFSPIPFKKHFNYKQK